MIIRQPSDRSHQLSEPRRTVEIEARSLVQSDFANGME